MRSLTIIWTVLLFDSSNTSNYNLAGAHLKMSAYDNFPYDVLVRHPDGNYTYDGSSGNVVDWLAVKLNFTYSVVPVFKDEALRLKISDFELGLQKVINKEADGTVPQYIADPDRAAKMDYTFFVSTELFTLVVPKPQPVSRLFAFIRPFQPIVWLLTGLVALLFIAIMVWFSWIYKHKIGLKKQSANQSRTRLEEITDNIGYYAIYVTNILTNHGMYIYYAQHSFRILAAGWLLASLVLVNSYSSIVVSSLTVPIKNPPINTFEDLAVSKDVSLILRQDLVITKQILGAKTGVFKILGDSIRDNPDRLLNSFPAVYNKLEDGRYAYSFIISFNRYFVWKKHKTDGKCVFLLSDPLSLSTGYFCLLMQKGSPYTPALNHGLVRLLETGMQVYWLGKQTPKAEECTVSKEKNTQSVGRQTKIKLEDLTGAFFILGAGLGFAVLSFFIELFVHRIRKRIRKLAEMKRSSAVGPIAIE